MNELSNLQKSHTAGAQDLGYVYQFYYFVLLALKLGLGHKIGFEVKDDIHIDKDDGTTVLFQAKHTIYENQNLTTLDVDLWKTLSNWAGFIKAGDKNFLEKHSFVLVTNKNEGNNEFIDTLSSFKANQDINVVLSKLNELKDRTVDKTIKKYISSVCSMGKPKIKQFVTNFTIESIDNIIEQIKSVILDQIRGEERLVQPIYEKLIADIHKTKYLEIKGKNEFEISREEFDRKFRRCFYDAYKDKPLPTRHVPALLPENLEEQIFIKQLLDIGEIENGSPRITEYTTHMLKALNSFSYWMENGYVLPTEMDDFEKNNILMWNSEFYSKYRRIRGLIKEGKSISELENDIRNLGIELVDYLRRQDLSILTYPALGLEISNGHFYALSDELKIGWHYDWENKYKKK
jgi:hypothetical protein